MAMDDQPIVSKEVFYNRFTDRVENNVPRNHHDSEYLRAQYELDPHYHAAANPDNCAYYPGEMGYLPDGTPIVHEHQLPVSDALIQAEVERGLKDVPF